MIRLALILFVSYALLLTPCFCCCFSAVLQFSEVSALSVIRADEEASAFLYVFDVFFIIIPAVLPIKMPVTNYFKGGLSSSYNKNSYPKWSILTQNLALLLIFPWGFVHNFD
ncbi:unnamed protein product [Moneuplotes crassus]|uniref:Uncharacterized protein n=1 Tax=Euplotes crassus TaxID=5936 RepID=A0AAD1UH62_EUPCR|nr:unnamed protein product [Moneuplotes crassus]